MKGLLILVAVLVAFAAAVVGLVRMVGGQVQVAGVRSEQTVSLDVAFALTDAAQRPIPEASVRVVVGRVPESQPAEAGQRFTTDASGTFRFTTTARMDRTPKKRPTNFLDSLFSRPQTTDHLVAGVELDYMTFRWLYVFDLFRFQDEGDVMSEGLRVFTRDAQGRFTQSALHDESGWHMADLDGLSLTTPGNELSDFSLDRQDRSADAWTLSLTFRRLPDAVLR